MSDPLHPRSAGAFHQLALAAVERRDVTMSRALSATSARRRQRLRAVAVRLDSKLGPDRSELIHDYGDGWAIRRPDRFDDQRREGVLMANCLRRIGIGDTDPNCFSLRDPENLPHASFAAWRCRRENPILIGFESDNQIGLLVTPRAVLLGFGRAGSPLKSEYTSRLGAFAESRSVSDLEPFPTGLTQMWDIVFSELHRALELDDATLDVLRNAFRDLHPLRELHQA